MRAVDSEQTEIRDSRSPSRVLIAEKLGQTVGIPRHEATDLVFLHFDEITLFSILRSGAEVKETTDVIGMACEIPIAAQRGLEHAVASLHCCVKNDVELPISKEPVD